MVKYILDIYVRREGLADILCMAGVACYGNRVTPAKGGSSLVLYKKRYSLLRMDQTNVICWVECRLVYNYDGTIIMVSA